MQEVGVEMELVSMTSMMVSAVLGMAYLCASVVVVGEEHPERVQQAKTRMLKLNVT